MIAFLTRDIFSGGSIVVRMASVERLIVTMLSKLTALPGHAIRFINVYFDRNAANGRGHFRKDLFDSLFLGLSEVGDSGCSWDS